MRSRGLLAGLIGLGLCAPAHGQESLCLRPESFRVEPGTPLRVHLESAAAPVAWDNDRVLWLFVKGEGTQENMDRAPGEADAVGAITLPTPPRGTGVVGLDLRPREVEVDAEALRVFAAAKCGRPLPADVKGKVRLTVVPSCKALIRVGDGPGAAVFLETGQHAEIVARMDPTTTPVGGDIGVEAAIDGADLEDIRVLATHLPTGKSQEFRTGDEGGGSHFRVTGAGRWRVEFHDLRRIAGTWTLTSATMMFEVPEETPKGTK